MESMGGHLLQLWPAAVDSLGGLQWAVSYRQSAISYRRSSIGPKLREKRFSQPLKAGS
jgi:hypothetical protein